MAHLVRPWQVRYVDQSGKRCPKGTTGAKKRKERAAKWYAQGVPGLPAKKRVPLATDKRVAQRMLDELVERAERGGVGLPDLDHARRPLAQHWPTSRHT
jgi:hypothetical protein